MPTVKVLRRIGSFFDFFHLVILWIFEIGSSFASWLSWLLGSYFGILAILVLGSSFGILVLSPNNLT